MLNSQIWGASCSQPLGAGIMRPVDKEWHKGKENKKTKKAKAELINQFDPSYLKKPLCAKLLGTKNETWGDSNVHCCMLSSGRGGCSWSNWEGGPPGSATWDGQAALDPWAMIEAARSNNKKVDKFITKETSKDSSGYQSMTDKINTKLSTDNIESNFKQFQLRLNNWLHLKF